LEAVSQLTLWDFLVEADARREMRDEIEELMNYLTLAQLLDDDVIDILYLDTDSDDSDV
jgi:hypothetical protein